MAKQVKRYSLSDCGWTAEAITAEAVDVGQWIEANQVPVDIGFMLRSVAAESLDFLNGCEVVRFRSNQGSSEYEVQVVKVTPDDALAYAVEKGSLWERRVISGRSAKGDYCFLPSVLSVYGYAYWMASKRDGWHYAPSMEKADEAIARYKARALKHRQDVSDYVRRESEGASARNASSLAALVKAMSSK